MPALASLSQADLDALAAEQAAQEAAAGAAAPVPPPDPGPPPQPTYVATDPGYDVAYPGPPPQPTYVPTTASAPAAPLPSSPSLAGPAAPPPPPPEYGTAAPAGNDVVTSTYPATGTTSVPTKDGPGQPVYPIQVAQTYRLVPPPGSTFPTTETAYGVPPRNDARLRQMYERGGYPDLEPRFPGDGPLGQGPPKGPNGREVPSDIYDHLLMPFWRGEGNMGYQDPLAPPFDRPVLGAGGYVYGPGETTPESTWVPGTASPFTAEQTAHRDASMRAAGRPDLIPPPGYVPQMWNAKGHLISSYWYDRAPEPQDISPQPPHGEDVLPVPPPSAWQGEGPTGNAAPTPSRAQLLLDLERRRRERGLRGLFGGR